MHPRYEGCALTSITFENGRAWAHIERPNGERLTVVAGLAFIGTTLREVQRLERPQIRSVR